MLWTNRSPRNVHFALGHRRPTRSDQHVRRCLHLGTSRWFQEAEAVDILKIDAEGSDPSVLAGATKTIRQWRPIVYFEYNPLLRSPSWHSVSLDTVVEDLERVGYRATMTAMGTKPPARSPSLYPISGKCLVSTNASPSRGRQHPHALRGWANIVCVPLVRQDANQVLQSLVPPLDATTDARRIVGEDDAVYLPTRGPAGV